MSTSLKSKREGLSGAESDSGKLMTKERKISPVEGITLGVARMGIKKERSSSDVSGLLGTSGELEEEQEERDLKGGHKKSLSMDAEVDLEGEEDEEGECRHRTIISSGGKQVCARCATCLETSELPSFAPKDGKKKEVKNILKDLEKYSF